MEGIQNLKSQIMNLNTSQRGSFGEYLFGKIRILKGENVTAYRSDEFDLLVNQIRVDVKTTITQINNIEPESYKIFKNNRKNEFVEIIFLQNKTAFHSRNKKEWNMEIDYVQVENFWNDWKIGDKIPQTKELNLKEHRNTVKKEFENQLDKELEKKVYIIFRGNEQKFTGKKANPDNLAYDGKVIKSQIIIYLRFKNNSIDFEDGACFDVKDLKVATERAKKLSEIPSKDFFFDEPPLIPLEYSWGHKKRINKLMVSIEKARKNPNAYSSILFNSISFEEFKHHIIQKFNK